MTLPSNYEAMDWKERRACREEYQRIQKGICCHCGTYLAGSPSKEMMGKKINFALFPPNFFKWPIHLHHSHTDGNTIGAVHNLCNAVLWQYHGE